MSDELLHALIDALEHLDIYYIAVWDDEQRRRVRVRMAKVCELLKAEQKRRKKEEAHA
jgi:hypothetical protein